MYFLCRSAFNRTHVRMVLASMIVTCVIASFVILFSMSGVKVRKAVLKESSLNAAHGVIQYYSEGEYIPSQPLLVLFTTFIITPDNAHIYRNTLRNWGQLQPAVQPVLFHDDMDSEWVLLAQGWGWATLPVPAKLDNKLPFLKAMYREIYREFQADYYAYANGDILFDESLVLTLWTLQQNRTRNVFVVGRRTNYHVSPATEFSNLAAVRQAATRMRARLFIKDAQDFFISTQGSFPWSDIPNFVVGRIGYDNWLVQHALRRHIMVIDATNSILALHQTGRDGVFAGFAHYLHLKYNQELVGIGFDYSLGTTDCAPWATDLDHEKGGVQLNHRIPNPCARHFARLGVVMLDNL